MDRKLVHRIGNIAKERHIGIHMDEGAGIIDIGPAGNRFHGRFYFVAPDTGQETQPAEIDSHDGNLFILYQGDRIKQGTIATQADDKFNFFGKIFG
jgi:hypothetical protein